MAGRLTLTVEKATDLRSVCTFGKQDPYCEIVVGKTTKKTSVCDGGGKNPVWNETFTWDLTADELETDIKVHLLDKNITADSRIGALYLNANYFTSNPNKNLGCKWSVLSNRKLRGHLHCVGRFETEDYEPGAEEEKVEALADAESRNSQLEQELAEAKRIAAERIAAAEKDAEALEAAKEAQAALAEAERKHAEVAAQQAREEAAALAAAIEAERIAAAEREAELRAKAEAALAAAQDQTAVLRAQLAEMPNPTFEGDETDFEGMNAVADAIEARAAVYKQLADIHRAELERMEAGFEHENRRIRALRERALECTPVEPVEVDTPQDGVDQENNQVAGTRVFALLAANGKYVNTETGLATEDDCFSSATWMTATNVDAHHTILNMHQPVAFRSFSTNLYLVRRGDEALFASEGPIHDDFFMQLHADPASEAGLRAGMVVNITSPTDEKCLTCVLGGDKSGVTLGLAARHDASAFKVVRPVVDFSDNTLVHAESNRAMNCDAKFHDSTRALGSSDSISLRAQSEEVEFGTPHVVRNGDKISLYSSQHCHYLYDNGCKTTVFTSGCIGAGELFEIVAEGMEPGAPMFAGMEFALRTRDGWIGLNGEEDVYAGCGEPQLLRFI